MIQANELRINSVLLWGVKLIIVKGIHTDTVLHDKTPHIYAEIVGSNFVYMCFHLNDVDPIPITPEILEKCGFEKLQDDGAFWMEKQVKIGETTIIFSEGDRNGFCEVFICGMDDVRAQSLHQLQNLYHAITGTELNVQL